MQSVCGGIYSLRSCDVWVRHIVQVFLRDESEKLGLPLFGIQVNGICLAIGEDDSGSDSADEVKAGNGGCEDVERSRAARVGVLHLHCHINGCSGIGLTRDGASPQGHDIGAREVVHHSVEVSGILVKCSEHLVVIGDGRYECLKRDVVGDIELTDGVGGRNAELMSGGVGVLPILGGNDSSSGILGLESTFQVSLDICEVGIGFSLGALD